MLHAYVQQVSWSEPHWQCYGIIVTPDGQSIWFDTLQRVLRST